MDKKAFVVTGLGYGDEGKGKTVHWLSFKHGAHTVVRTGGPQAFHRVVTSEGREHIHSQFGSGTLAGASTYLSQYMVIDPYAVLAEGRALVDDFGLANVFDKMTIHEDALVITPFQACMNRLRELVRADARYGSVGIGVGETVLDSEVLGEATVRAKDLGSPKLRDKLEVIRKRKVCELELLAEVIHGLPETLKNKAHREATNLRQEETVFWATEWFKKLARTVRIVSSSYANEEILDRPGTVVFEGSQGVLLDRWYGFPPYITKVRTTPIGAMSILIESRYNGDIKNLGVLRAYHTRHGAGPFVAESSELTKQLPDASNVDHAWQGSFRVGGFDMVAARYAVDVCRESRTLDGLVITCADRIQSIGKWPIVTSYSGPNDSRLLTDIRVSRKSGEEKLRYQEKLTDLLGQCSPNVATLSVCSNDVSCFSDVICDGVGLPVVAVSTGPTEKDCVETMK